MRKTKDELWADVSKAAVDAHKARKSWDALGMFNTYGLSAEDAERNAIQYADALAEMMATNYALRKALDAYALRVGGK